MIPNPREDDSFVTILTWSRNAPSPDDNPYPQPQDCVEHLLRKKFDPVELCRIMLRDKHLLSFMRVVYENGEIHVQTRPNRDGNWDDIMLWEPEYDQETGAMDIDASSFGVESDEDLFLSTLANQVDALSFLKQHVPLRTVYVLDHGMIRYSTSAFADSWDSAACGIAFIDPYADDVPDIDRDALLAIIDAEVAAYDRWFNGEYDEDADWYDETDLRCPECDNTADFDISCISLQGPVHVTPNGWDWSQGHSADYLAESEVTCSRCGHKAIYSEFVGN